MVRQYRVISQEKMASFREELGKSVKDPYQVVLKPKLPMSLLKDSSKTTRMNLLQVCVIWSSSPGKANPTLNTHSEHSEHPRDTFMNTNPPLNRSNPTTKLKCKQTRKTAEACSGDLDALVASASSKASKYSENETKDRSRKTDSEGNTLEKADMAHFHEEIFDKGTSRRIWRELYKVDSSDIIVFVLDARDPEGIPR